MSPFAGVFWNLVRTATGLGFIVGTACGIVIALVRGNRMLGLLATLAVYAIATVVSEELRFLFRFGGYGAPVLLFGYLGCVVPARILGDRGGWRPVWGTLGGLGVVLALMLAIRFTSGLGEWAALEATCVVDAGWIALWIWEVRSRA